MKYTRLLPSIFNFQFYIFNFFWLPANIPDWAEVATLRSTANLWGAFIYTI